MFLCPCEPTNATSIIIQVSHHWLSPYKLCLVGRTELHGWCCTVQYSFDHWTGRQLPSCVCRLAGKDIQMGINSDVYLGRWFLPYCWSLLCPAGHGPSWSLAGYVLPLQFNCVVFALHSMLCFSGLYCPECQLGPEGHIFASLRCLKLFAHFIVMQCSVRSSALT